MSWLNRFMVGRNSYNSLVFQSQFLRCSPVLDPNIGIKQPSIIKELTEHPSRILSARAQELARAVQFNALTLPLRQG